MHGKLQYSYRIVFQAQIRFGEFTEYIFMAKNNVRGDFLPYFNQ